MRWFGAEAGVKKFFKNSITENCEKVFKKTFVMKSFVVKVCSVTKSFFDIF